MAAVYPLLYVLSFSEYPGVTRCFYFCSHRSLSSFVSSRGLILYEIHKFKVIPGTGKYVQI